MLVAEDISVYTMQSATEVLDHQDDVEERCRHYCACTARKGPKEKGRRPLRIYNVGAPSGGVTLDIVGEGNRNP